MPFPPFPNLPDDNPIQSLRQFRQYVRDVTNYVRPYQLIAASTLSPIFLFGCTCLVVGVKESLSWFSDLVPLFFAVISVLVSVKKLRDEHQTAVISVVLVLGLGGSLIMHYSRTHTESVHHDEIVGLQQRMEGVRQDNSSLLKLYTAKPTVSTEEATLERRQGILKIIRGEYVLSHEHVSPGLLEGTESPPDEWVNKRLRELGENWTVTTPPPPKPSIMTVEAEAEKDATVVTVFALGDDAADGLRMVTDPLGMTAPSFHCLPPATCFTEGDISRLKMPIVLEFSEKKTRRLFFAVANTSEATISKALVTVQVETVYGKEPDAITLSSPTGGRPFSHSHELEFPPETTRDILPYRRSVASYGFIADVTVADNPSLYVQVELTILAKNLIAHKVTVPLYIAVK